MYSMTSMHLASYLKTLASTAIFHYHVSTRKSTSGFSFRCSVLRMGYAHQSQDQSTSKQSKNPTNSPTIEALGQMLLTNQRIDKLAAYHVSVTTRNMLDGPCLAPGVLPVLPLPLPLLPEGTILMLMQLMCQGPSPEYHWQEIKVSQYSYLFRLLKLTPVFFCSMQLPLEST